MIALFQRGPFRFWRDRHLARPRLARADALSERELRDIGLRRSHRPDGRIIWAP